MADRCFESTVSHGSIILVWEILANDSRGYVGTGGNDVFPVIIKNVKGKIQYSIHFQIDTDIGIHRFFPSDIRIGDSSFIRAIGTAVTGAKNITAATVILLFVRKPFQTHPAVADLSERSPDFQEGDGGIVVKE
jgi:hypothetical protein